MDELQTCKYNFIFTSPEAILVKYRYLLKKKYLTKRLCAVVIDESHCIKKWGSSNDESNVFREWYNNIQEIRSLLYKPIPFVSTTATATKETRDYIIDNLNLRNPVMVVDTPQNSNVKYFVLNSSTKDVSIIFLHFINKLRTHEYDAERIIVFCRRTEDTRDIFNAFHSELGKNYGSYKTRPYAKFHASTDEDIKNHVLASFSIADGTVRFLAATIAFGMGVDCKGVYNVIHYGPPSSLDNYFQESGRVGRDGLQSYASLIVFPKSLATPVIDENVKKYCKEGDLCRRKLLLQAYDALPEPFSPLHNCCDICAKMCNCNNPECLVNPWYVDVISATNTCSVENVQIQLQILNDDGILLLNQKLLDIREKYLPDNCAALNVDLCSGFPLKCVDEITKIANDSFSEEKLVSHTSLLNKNCFPEVMTIVHSILANQSLRSSSSLGLTSSDKEDDDTDTGSLANQSLRSSNPLGLTSSDKEDGDTDTGSSASEVLSDSMYRFPDVSDSDSD